MSCTKALIEKIAVADPADYKVFAEIVSEVIDGGLIGEREFRERFVIRSETLARWRDGSSAPTIAFRERILDWIRRRIG